MSWTAAPGAVSAYRVSATIGTHPGRKHMGRGHGDSAVFTGLVAGTAYNFQVQAFGTYGSGPIATSPSVTPTGTPSTYASTVLADTPSLYFR